MSAHEKENGKGAEPDWVGLSCDADGQTEQRGGQAVKEVTRPRRLGSQRAAEDPSKCYCLVCRAGADFQQLPKALLRLLISLPFFSERSH